MIPRPSSSMGFSAFLRLQNGISRLYPQISDVRLQLQCHQSREQTRIAAGAFGPVASVMRQPSFIRKRSFSGERKGNGYTINRFGDTTIMTEGNAQTGSSGHGTR